ncbi:MAG TPA: TetR/AcrR family transcriptional regulator [Acidimicrobiales bacterium]|nr:TetR/AcrR family transcriptional regulator [Acidimicrobiales bacterium]
MVQNIVPELETELARQAVRRALAGRETAYVQEVQRLLDAGQALMEEAGTGAPVRVADIVRRAGLSNQAFYRHFPSRDAFVAAVVERGAARLASYVAHQVQKAAGPEDAVRRWITAVLSQAANRRVAGQTRAVMWNLQQLRPGTDGGSMRPPFEELLVEALRELGSPDPERDAAAIADVAFGRLHYHLWGPGATAEDVGHVVEFCLAAARRGAAG